MKKILFPRLKLLNGLVDALVLMPLEEEFELDSIALTDAVAVHKHLIFSEYATMLCVSTLGGVLSAITSKGINYDLSILQRVILGNLEVEFDLIRKDCRSEDIIFHELATNSIKEKFEEVFLSNTTEVWTRVINDIADRVGGILSDKYIGIACEEETLRTLVGIRNSYDLSSMVLHAYTEDDLNVGAELTDVDLDTLKALYDKHKMHELSPKYIMVHEGKKIHPSDPTLKFPLSEVKVYHIEV